MEYTLKKQNIYLEIIKALNEKSEKDSFVAFKTNFLGVEPLTTDLFDIEVLKIPSSKTFIKCFFKQYDNEEKPLLLLCENPDNDYIFYINTQMNLDKIHYKYNFIILNNDFYQMVNAQGEGKKIFLNYPLILDFTVKDRYTIEYFMTGTDDHLLLFFRNNKQ